jgi:hypothetical protein
MVSKALPCSIRNLAVFERHGSNSLLANPSPAKGSMIGSCRFPRQAVFESSSICVP